MSKHSMSEDEEMQPMGMLEPEPVNSTAVKIEPSKLETPAVEA